MTRRRSITADEADSSPDQPNKRRGKRFGSTASEWEARAIPFVVTLALIFFLLWLLGPIDLFGGRTEAGKFFVALAVPIVGVAWLYDPIAKRLRSRRHSESHSSLDGEAPTSRLDRQAALERTRMRADGRARKARSNRPFANHWATPVAYGVCVLLALGGMKVLIEALGVMRAYDGGALTYVLAVGGFLGGAFLYEPIISALDRRGVQGTSER